MTRNWINLLKNGMRVGKFRLIIVEVKMTIEVVD
jgi:hypothetical protein